MERLNKLRKAIDEKMELLEDEFWLGEKVPYILYNEITIVHIFYDEAFMYEVNPREYYNISDSDLEKFFKFYNV